MVGYGVGTESPHQMNQSKQRHTQLQARGNPFGPNHRKNAPVTDYMKLGLGVQFRFAKLLDWDIFAVDGGWFTCEGYGRGNGRWSAAEKHVINITISTDAGKDVAGIAGVENDLRRMMLKYVRSKNETVLKNTITVGEKGKRLEEARLWIEQ
jgi:hypothetical protein